MNSKPKSDPANKASFKKLLAFGKQILHICELLNITPVVYGSLAYFAQTKDETLPIRDLDLLVPEASFPDFIRELDKLKGINVEVKPYHSIEIYKGDLEIDLDAIEHFLDPRSRATSEHNIHGLKFHVPSVDVLISIYQEALDNMPKIDKLEEKRAKYTRKLNNLKKLTI